VVLSSWVTAPPILLVHPDRRAQRIVQRVLAGIGYRVEVADDFEHGLARLAELHPRLVVVDGSAAAPSAAPLLTAARAAGTEACMALLDAAQVAELPRILGLGAVTNLLVHPMPVLGEELMVTAQKLLRDDLFGAEKYLLWGTELEAITLTRASQRTHVVGELADQVRARGLGPRAASVAMLVADELISNAVHNAPVDDAGAHYRADLPRDGELELDPRHRVALRWGCDGRYLAVEVTDRFGSLDRDTILRALVRTKRSPLWHAGGLSQRISGARHARDEMPGGWPESGQPPEASGFKDAGGGAGMGIALAYRSCDHLVFNLAPGKRTEVIALIDVRSPHGERVPASSYNVFVER